MKRRGLAYMVRGRAQLYLALTNRSNSTTIIASRGPGFAFGKSFEWLEDGHEPSAADLVSAVLDAHITPGFETWDRRNIVFAGGGEPLLCAEQLHDTVTDLLNNPGPAASPYEFRVVTNGLFPRETVTKYLAGRITSASVALNGHDERSYREIMAPEDAAVRWCLHRNASGLTAGAGALTVVHDFVQECRASGMTVDVTCIDRPELLDLSAVEAFAVGSGSRFRLRTYFA